MSSFDLFYPLNSPDSRGRPSSALQTFFADLSYFAFQKMADPLSDFLAREQDAFAELEDAAPARKCCQLCEASWASSLAVPVVENDVVDDQPPTQNGHSGSLSNGGDSAADLSSLDAAPINPTPVLNGEFLAIP